MRTRRRALAAPAVRGTPPAAPCRADRCATGDRGADYAYGGVRIQGAPRDAQVFVDGYYAGIVDDFDGPFQHLDLEAGAHQIEIRAPGLPPLQYDVNVQPGQTLTVHVR